MGDAGRGQFARPRALWALRTSLIAR